MAVRALAAIEINRSRNSGGVAFLIRVLSLPPTIAIIPIDSFRVELRLTVKGLRIRGQFRTSANTDWREAGECDLPVQGPPITQRELFRKLMKDRGIPSSTIRQVDITLDELENSR